MRHGSQRERHVVQPSVRNRERKPASRARALSAKSPRGRESVRKQASRAREVSANRPRGRELQLKVASRARLHLRPRRPSALMVAPSTRFCSARPENIAPSRPVCAVLYITIAPSRPFCARAPEALCATDSPLLRCKASTSTDKEAGGTCPRLHVRW